MTWQTFTAWAGNIWGKTTTVVMGVGLAVQGILLDPGSQSFIAMIPWAPKAIAIFGVFMVLMRFVTPPPPVVTIQTEDEVHVDRVDNSATVIKDEPIGDTIVEKAAGEVTS